MNPLAFVTTVVLAPITLGLLVELSTSGPPAVALVCLAAIPCIGLGVHRVRDQDIWVRNPPLPDWLSGPVQPR